MIKSLYELWKDTTEKQQQFDIYTITYEIHTKDGDVIKGNDWNQIMYNKENSKKISLDNIEEAAASIEFRCERFVGLILLDKDVAYD